MSASCPDATPRVPPRLLGYRSIGTKLLFGADGLLGVVASLRAELADAAEVMRVHWDAGDLRALASHSIARYVEHLGANLEFRPLGRRAAEKIVAGL